MASIALVSGRLSSANANVNTDAMLVAKGHTVTFFDQSAVTAVNLAAFALIYVNMPDQDDATFEGFIRGYMRTDNIPVLCAGFDGSGVVTDSLTTRLGIAQSVEGVTSPNATTEDAVLVDTFEDLQVVAGLDPDFATKLREANDEGWFIPKGSKHKGTTLLRDANDNVVMFQSDNTDTDFTDTSQVLGARFVFVGWSGKAGHGRDGAALVESAIQWATFGASFFFPTTGNQFAITRPVDLDRMANYSDSEVNWTEVVPASTTITVDDSQDELVTFNNVASPGNEINGFVASDPTTGFVFIRWTLASTVTGSTPEVEQGGLVLVGQSPSMRQLGDPSAPLHDDTVLAQDNWYTGGLVTFIDGLNAGLSMEVRKWVNTTRAIELFLPMTFAIVVGDRFTIYTGCDKTVAACQNKFANINNFRGEPYVPGNDHLFRAPDNPLG